MYIPNLTRAARRALVKLEGPTWSMEDERGIALPVPRMVPDPIRHELYSAGCVDSGLDITVYGQRVREALMDGDET